jgi:hypothetical protein
MMEEIGKAAGRQLTLEEKNFVVSQLRGNSGALKQVLEQTMVTTWPEFKGLLCELVENSQNFKQGHIKALKQNLSPKVWHEMLGKFNWSVTEFEKELVLPDCLIWGVGEDDRPYPIFLWSECNCKYVVMPVDKNLALIGSSGGEPQIEVGEANKISVSLAGEFIVSSQKESVQNIHPEEVGARLEELCAQITRDADIDGILKEQLCGG